jgi:hypothetical protein
MMSVKVVPVETPPEVAVTSRWYVPAGVPVEPPPGVVELGEPPPLAQPQISRSIRTAVKKANGIRRNLRETASSDSDNSANKAQTGISNRNAPGAPKGRSSAGADMLVRGAVVTETVTAVAAAPLNVTGLGDIEQVVFGMEGIGVQVSVTVPENV